MTGFVCEASPPNILLIQLGFILDNVSCIVIEQ